MFTEGFKFWNITFCLLYVIVYFKFRLTIPLLEIFILGYVIIKLLDHFGHLGVDTQLDSLDGSNCGKILSSFLNIGVWILVKNERFNQGLI